MTCGHPRLGAGSVGLLVGLSLVGAVHAALLPARDSVTVATPALVLMAPGHRGRRRRGPARGGRHRGGGGAWCSTWCSSEPYGTLTSTWSTTWSRWSTFGAVAFTVATLVAQATDRRRAAEQRAERGRCAVREQERIRGEQERLASEKSALEQAEEARRALLRSVSHDLRTPLAAIRAITSDLRAGPTYDEADPATTCSTWSATRPSGSTASSPTC